ncbi:sigma-54 interaction domain-containing protein [Raineya orbicola]|uniref:Sigma-54 interaction domain n=1 Tax=Raineya orbicola TaxID=2016530 RepID=A0A2N3IJL4_9BACT|nr:sigma-54 dependent transcriptional regulator [Raineya orbicola]PKQ70515.1 Sigma-54 interaction domain [Raineya orbicola]
MITNLDLQSIKQRFGIVGNAPLLNHALERAIMVAPTEINVLITGESGVGKESFSKIIHQLSPRKHNAFTAVNCGAIPEGTIDSELFGHEKGAFTGAVESRKGFFEVTNGGTIFLDEIGEMPLATQARLLRVLEYGEFIKVGSSKVQKTDVRVVAATNVNLEEAIRKGKFREDLYYRLSTVPIYVPALRERGNDVLLLFRKFATDFAEKYRRDPIELNEEAKNIILNYRFPGNIRQLKNLVYDLSITAESQIITADILQKYLPKAIHNNLPALVENENQQQTFSDRELLYKVLFDMRKDVTELKKLVLQMLTSGSSLAGAEILKNHQDLFKEVQGFPAVVSSESNIGNKVVLPVIQSESSVIPFSESTEQIEDIPHETEEETLSLEKKEKELIIKALKQHNGKRKYAAEDLGISERTLYRKIKKYGLE